MKAVIAKCLKPQVLLSNLMEYVDIFLENVTTDITVSNMAYFAKSAIGKLDIDSIRFVTMPYEDAGDGIHLVPVGEKLVETINESFNPYLEDIRIGELDLVARRASNSASASKSTATPKPTEGRPETKTTQPPAAPAVTETEPPAEPEETAGLPTPEPTQEAATAPTPVPTDAEGEEETEPDSPVPSGGIALLPPMPTPVPT